MYFWKELELDEGRKLQKREEKCITKSEKNIRNKRNNAEEFENLVESHLLRFQKAWQVKISTFKGCTPDVRSRSVSQGLIPCHLVLDMIHFRCDKCIFSGHLSNLNGNAEF